MKKIVFVILMASSVVVWAKKTERKPNQASEQLNEAASKTIGNLLREAEKKGDKSIVFGGGPQVTTYSVGNFTCYFQNSDDSVSCGVSQ